ncbi:MAG: hypothetical protein CVV06_16165 [Gammaproteobacteria bacterium HGW-Gammaproteobacteria-10]|nr:MAG: hypothetical protein CVV06_16165 [Gammaproteobacteria bacterium HGW-Gammaproteobacteria-10]
MPIEGRRKLVFGEIDGNATTKDGGNADFSVNKANQNSNILLDSQARLNLNGLDPLSKNLNS